MKQINILRNYQIKPRKSRNHQRGGLTIFSAILILILMTTVLVYSTRTSVFESRISGNEVKQKEAFDIAEAAADQGMMYVLANSNAVLSSRENVFPDGTASSFTKDGWFAPGNAKWALCPADPGVTHPCGGAVPAKPGSYFYDTNADATTIESMPVNETVFPPGRTARMSALLCFVDLTNPMALNCEGPVGTVEEESNSALMITLLSYGYSDCTDVTDVSTCTAEARVAMPIATDKVLAGSPTVPLVAKTTLPLSGTFEVVGNPNGGGVGVSLTSWMNASSDLLSGGSWQTCEMQEWYHTTEAPEGVACTDNNCLCGPGGNDTTHFMSYKKGTETNISIDIIQDPDFPDDLFEFYFGVPRAEYMKIKGTAKQITNCNSLGPSSSGLFWVNGASCKINAGTVVGSPLAPVILVSAATDTSINGGAEIFGVVYIFDDDPPGSVAKLSSTGGAKIYGAVIIDGEIDNLQGSFSVIYNSAVIAAAAGIAGVGAVNGGWRDFGLPDIAW